MIEPKDYVMRDCKRIPRSRASDGAFLLLSFFAAGFLLGLALSQVFGG